MGNDQRRLKVWLGIDVIKRKIINFLIFFNEGRTQTLNDAGGGVKMTHWSGDRLPFLTGSLE